jgi:hypothetical protein
MGRRPAAKASALATSACRPIEPAAVRFLGLPSLAPLAFFAASAQQLFAGSAPKYREASGLIRKYYLLSEDGGTAGGVYLWKSKKDAAELYTKEWENVIRERYGALPTVTYFESPVVVDNLTNEIISNP